MTQLYMGRTHEEIAAALALWDQHKKPKSEALAGLGRVYHDGILNPYPALKEAVGSGMVMMAEITLENDTLRREREDLRMFCKGMANNIEKMLK